MYRVLRKSVLCYYWYCLAWLRSYDLLEWRNRSSLSLKSFLLLSFGKRGEWEMTTQRKQHRFSIFIFYVWIFLKMEILRLVSSHLCISCTTTLLGFFIAKFISFCFTSNYNYRRSHLHEAWNLVLIHVPIVHFWPQNCEPMVNGQIDNIHTNKSSLLFLQKKSNNHCHTRQQNKYPRKQTSLLLEVANFIARLQLIIIFIAYYYNFFPW